MGLEYYEKAKRWEWEGNLRDLVAAVGNGDARMGFVLDKKSGAKIAVNIDGTDEPAEEPFYIESPDGENMHDAYNRKEAIKMLENARAGRDVDDDAPATAKRTKKKSRAKKSRSSATPRLRSMR
jgi:hypothetical protein